MAYVPPPNNNPLNHPLKNVECLETDDRGRRHLDVMLPARDLTLVGLDELPDGRWQCYLRERDKLGALRRGMGDTPQEAIDDSEKAIRESLRLHANALARSQETRSALTPHAKREVKTPDEKTLARRARRAARKAARAAQGGGEAEPEDQDDDVGDLI